MEFNSNGVLAYDSQIISNEFSKKIFSNIGPELARDNIPLHSKN